MIHCFGMRLAKVMECHHDRIHRSPTRQLSIESSCAPPGPAMDHLSLSGAVSRDRTGQGEMGGNGMACETLWRWTNSRIHLQIAKWLDCHLWQFDSLVNELATSELPPVVAPSVLAICSSIYFPQVIRAKVVF